MFKSGSFEEEIRQSMEKTLVANQVEKNHSLKKLAQAADYLNAAAEIFEQAGMSEHAEEITEVLQGLVNQFSGKTS
jgi:hypothetical protein